MTERLRAALDDVLMPYLVTTGILSRATFDAMLDGVASRLATLTPIAPNESNRADARAIVTAINLFPLYEAVREAAGPIARLSDEDVRDYEQGACFFCGGGSEVIPGPRGGVTGERPRRRVHEPDCDYIALRAALDALQAAEDAL